MTANIILQKLVENERESLAIPAEWQYRDLESFGLDWKLFPYQMEAVNNAAALLYLIFNGYETNGNKEENKRRIEENRKELLELYRRNGLGGELEEDLSILQGSSENFEFLADFYEHNGQIAFENFINRAAFWMATGSGKTLVMIKLIAILANLINKKLIPQKDILILAPKEEILNQIKEHVDKFNKGSEIKINLRSVKEYERVKNQQSIFNSYEVTVFYYRADNIAGKDMVAKKQEGQRLDYEGIYNNGDWYLILDEAHKGEKETSKRQQYFMLLTQNGFLFNFSATFTDGLDIVTTIFDYKLDTFLKDGYGKMLYVADSDFKNFRSTEEDDFSENEKKNIITQTLLIFAIAKLHYHKLKSIDNKLYHPPLLITLANSVNTDEADLKIFYKLLAHIAEGDFDFNAAKNRLVDKLEKNDKYLFGLGELDLRLVPEIRALSEQEFRKAVFNSKNKGNIQVIKFRNNTRELAFKLANSPKYFMLIHASDIIKWEENVLEGYEFGKEVEESFFKNIEERPDINILLGSRIFAEGWDTNRPNIINFINIGVSGDAKKYVMQSIGRGVRIEPMPNQRQRFELIGREMFSDSNIEKIKRNNKMLESLFVFATNKEVVKGILEGLEKQSHPEWIKINGIRKNEAIKEIGLPIFIPFFGETALNNKPFWIGKNEYKELSDYVNKAGPRVLLLKNNIKLRSYNKAIDSSNFSIGERRRRRTPENILFVANHYFNEPIRKLSEIKILDGEISHFNEVRTNIEKEEAEKLERDIFKIIKPRLTEEEIDKLFEDKKITLKEYKQKIKDLATRDNFEVLNTYLNFKVLREHYYSPILFRQDSDKFQHIIKKGSEIKFLESFTEYLQKDSNELKKYDWWYFSKIDESIDNIGIPYFNSEEGKYLNFFPDFIFWLKKDGKYYLKFIDPKGVEYTTNPASKIDGFNEFLEDYKNLVDKKFEEIELFYFNERQPSFEISNEYKKYWTGDFNKIFGGKKSDLFFSDVISDGSFEDGYIPILSLEVAAGVFGDEQHIDVLGWKKLKTKLKINKDLFIAKVVGKSMESTIPANSPCLFRFERGGSRNGKIVLVESRQVTDPETHQKFTIKRYSSEKEYFKDGTWRHKKIVLSPDNKDFDDIVLENVSENDFRVVAEFICVL